MKRHVFRKKSLLSATRCIIIFFEKKFQKVFHGNGHPHVIHWACHQFSKYATSYKCLFDVLLLLIPFKFVHNMLETVTIKGFLKHL